MIFTDYILYSLINPSLSIRLISGRVPLALMSLRRLSVGSVSTVIKPLASSGLKGTPVRFQMLCSLTANGLCARA